MDRWVAACVPADQQNGNSAQSCETVPVPTTVNNVLNGNFTVHEASN
ncbi:MAG: hypothetical protein LC798_14990 [Chloroflexi bacterium]|nr:hypothetical protein [Chloroflexota bacterium]